MNRLNPPIRNLLECLAALPAENLPTPQDTLLLLLGAALGTQAAERGASSAGTSASRIVIRHPDLLFHAVQRLQTATEQEAALTGLLAWTRQANLESQLGDAAFQREIRYLLSGRSMLFRLLPATASDVAGAVLKALLAGPEFVTLHGARWLRDGFATRPAVDQLAEQLLSQVKQRHRSRLDLRAAAPPANHVYVSYAPTDGLAAAVEFCGLLTQAGIDVWLDQTHIAFDDEWDLAVQWAIEDCRLFLVLLTPDQARSAVYHHERRLADRGHRQVVYASWEHVDDALLPDDGPLIDLRHPADVVLHRLRGMLSQPEIPRPDTELVRQQRERTRLSITTAVRPLRSGVDQFQRFLDLMADGGRTIHIDRFDEQRRLQRAIVEQRRLVVIHGPPGVGKTRLACQVLRGLSPSAISGGAIDIVGFSTDNTHLGVDQVYSGLLQRLPAEQRSPLDRVWSDPTLALTQKANVLFEALVDRHWVIVLDGLHPMQDPETGQFKDSAWEALIQAAIACPGPLTLLVTTRTAPRFTAPIPLPTLDLELKGLLDEDAVMLLRASAAGLREVPDPALIEISQPLQGIPLALAALAAVLRADSDVGLEELPAADAVPGLVQEALRCLSPADRQVVEILAVFAGPVSQRGIEFVLADFTETSQVQTILENLARQRIVCGDRHRQWWTLSWHDDYAYRRVPPGSLVEDRLVPPAEAAAAEILHELGIAVPVVSEAHYTRVALHYRAATYYQLIRLPVEAWYTLDDLAPQLAEFEHYIRAGGYHDAAALLTQFDVRCLAAWGHFQLMIDLHERLQGNLDDPMLASLSAGHLAHAYAAIRQLDQAVVHYERALVNARAAENPRAEAMWLEGLGRLYYRMDQLGRSAESFGQALAIAQEFDDVPAQARRASFLGLVYYALGELDRALECLQQALTIHLEMGERQAEATDRGNLGLVYYALGELERALAHHQQALSVHLELGDHQAEATNRGNLGLVYYALGELDRALECHQQALMLSRQIMDRSIEAFSLSNLGETQLARGELDVALDLLESAVSLLSDRDAPLALHYCTCALAAGRLIARDFTGAQQAILAARAFGVAANNYLVAALSGLIALCRDDPAVASIAFQDALRRTTALLAKSAAPNVLYARALAQAGLASMAEADPQRAIEDYRHARQICPAPGLLTANLRLLDILEGCTTNAAVRQIRNALTGDHH